MGAVAAAKSAYLKSKAWLTGYLANNDPYAGIANTGAFIVWSNQPFYPLYVAWLVGGHNAWPSLLTWLSTPAFVAVPILARRESLAGRCLFVGAGLANTLLSAKAFGTASGVGWFVIPCLVITLTFFRVGEWRAIIVLTACAALSGLAIGHLGTPFHAYTPAEYQALTKLNLYSVTALTLYLLVAAIRLNRRGLTGNMRHS